MSLYKKFSIIIPASKDEKDFSLISKLKDRFSGHEIILALDSENQLTLDELHEINLKLPLRDELRLLFSVQKEVS